MAQPAASMHFKVNCRDSGPYTSVTREWVFCRWCGQGEHLDLRDLALSIGSNLSFEKPRGRGAGAAGSTRARLRRSGRITVAQTR